MNEEEIIKILSDEIVALNVGHEKYEEAVEGLLDLYQKEKEKNKELQIYMKEYLIPKSTINLVYISKDKIINKAEEYKKMLDTLNKAKDIDTIKAINERLIAFQEILLLEERN